MNCEFPDVQAAFEKGRRTRDQIANIHWIIENATEFEKKHKYIYFQNVQYTYLNMQIKKHTLYHIIPVRMAIIKKSTNRKCWRDFEENGSLLNCFWEMTTDTTIMENSMEIP